MPKKRLKRPCPKCGEHELVFIFGGRASNRALCQSCGSRFKVRAGSTVKVDGDGGYDAKDPKTGYAYRREPTDFRWSKQINGKSYVKERP